MEEKINIEITSEGKEEFEKAKKKLEEYERKNRLGQALEMRGMKQVELCEKLGCKSASVTSWVKNRWQPKWQAVYKMAEILDVSEMWLAGYEVPMQRLDESEETSNLCVEIKIDRQFRDLVKGIKSLSPEKYDLIRKLVDIFVENERISSENIEKEE